MSGIAPILAGQFMARYASTANTFDESFQRLSAAVTLAGTMICLFYHLSCNVIEREPKRHQWHQQQHLMFC